MAVSGDALDFAMDDSEPSDSPGSESQSSSDGTAAESMGPWLDEPKDVVYKLIHEEVERQEPAAKNLYERHRRNTFWRQGKPFARLIEKTEDRGMLKAWLPPFSKRTAPLPNKNDDLCNKVVSQVTTDPPVPEVQPATAADEDRDSAEYATRYLKAMGGESSGNDLRIMRDAMDISCTHASAYVHLYAHPAGGGWRPLEIEAHPTSQTVEDALIKQVPTGALDPLTGQPAMAMVKTTDGAIKRYVRADGSLTDNPIEADRQWIPKICREILKPEHVRFLPECASDINDAEGVILLRYCTLGEFKGMYPDVEGYNPEQLRKLVGWRPPRHKCLLPKHIIDRGPDESASGTAAAADDTPPDYTLVYYYLAYQKSTPIYPEGAYVVASAGTVHARGPLSKEVQRRDGKMEKLCFDILISQFRSLNDPLEGHPGGMAIIERFGPGNEYRAAILTAVLQNIDQILNPNVFLPITSPVRPRALAARDGNPIRIGSVEDKPTFETPQAIPDWAATIVQMIDKDMDSGSGLHETAQGLETPRSVSGVAKRTAVEQSLVALGQVFQNALEGMQRMWRIHLQLARAEIPFQIQIGYVGEDGAYKQEAFSGSDLAGAKDVEIAKGSGTMMSPLAKQEWLAGLQQYQWISPLDASEAIRGRITGLLGIQDNPHLMRVRRSLVEWRKGIPEGWVPPQPQLDPATNQPMVNPETGEPILGPPSYNPFEPRVNDEEPEVAIIRVRELSRAIASNAYAKHPPEWKALIDAEYERMRYAAGIQTMREQAQAAQMAAEQQQLAAEEEQAGAAAADADKADRAAGEADKDRTHERESQESKQRFELQRESVKARSKSSS